MNIEEAKMWAAEWKRSFDPMPPQVECAAVLADEVERQREKILALILEKDRWQTEAERKFSLRRDIEALLGVQDRPASDEQFMAGVEAVRKLVSLKDAAIETLRENLHLADGDCCTLYDLREAVLAIDPRALDEEDDDAVGS